MSVPADFYRPYEPLTEELTAALDEFLRTGHYIGGPLVERFETQAREFIGAAAAVGCKSGTHALRLALLAAGVGPGDEVVTVGNTYYATAYAVIAVGVRPVFCEVQPDTGLINPEALVTVLSPRTRAVLPVHLYGLPAPLDELRAICRDRGLVLIEDCAHAWGTRYRGRFIGADSEFACWSFYPTKNLGAFGDAGMVMTTSPGHAAEMRRLRYLGDDSRTVFDPRALHARLDPLQATLLSVVLRRFEAIARRRQALARRYRQALGGRVWCLPDPDGADVVPYVFPVRVRDRDRFLEAVAGEGVRLGVHYSVNLHWLPEFGASRPGSLPLTERHNAEIVSLPVHPSVSDEEAEAVCRAVLRHAAEP